MRLHVDKSLIGPVCNSLECSPKKCNFLVYSIATTCGCDEVLDKTLYYYNLVLHSKISVREMQFSNVSAI